MEESIKIKNFGPIKDAEIENIKPTVMLIGKSGSGKSLFMKLMKTVRTICNYANAYAVFEDACPEKKINEKSPFLLFVREKISFYLKEDTTILYRNGPFQLSYDGKENKFFLGKVRSYMSFFSKETFKYSDRYILSLINGGRITANRENDKYTDMNSDFFDEMKSISTLELPYVGYTFDRRKNVMTVKSPHENSHNMPIEECPSSVQSVLPIATAMNFYKNASLNPFLKSFLLLIAFENDSVKEYTSCSVEKYARKNKISLDMYVEEPEVHLFPGQQISFFNFIVRSIHDIREKRKTNIMISTHSPYILNYMNLLFLAHSKGTFIGGASVDFDETGIYFMENGTLRDICLKNAKLVDPKCLSSLIDDIYNKYVKLKAL